MNWLMLKQDILTENEMTNNMTRTQCNEKLSRLMAAHQDASKTLLETQDTLLETQDTLRTLENWIVSELIVQRRTGCLKVDWEALNRAIKF